MITLYTRRSLCIFSIFVVFSLFFAFGCGEEEADKIISTTPADGGEMSANGELKITFDKAVTEVKVNGTPADVAGTAATWKAQGLQPGQQTLKIEWIYEDGNTGSKQITLTIKESNFTPPGERITGNYAYVADYGGGLRVIKVSDPTNPHEVGSCDR
jgi:hypothetical protein